MIQSCHDGNVWDLQIHIGKQMEWYYTSFLFGFGA